MLSDEVINKVIERLVNRIEQGNEYVLKKIGESVKKLGTLSPSKAQELAQIMKYGGDYDKIVKKLAEITKLNVQDIYKIFREVAKNDYEFAEQFYKYRNKKYIPWKDNEVLRQQVDALAKITADKYRNISNSLAFMRHDKNGRVVYTNLARTYQNALDEAILNVDQGKETFENATYRILKELAESGIRTIDYESGRSMRMDSAVRMAMQGGLRNLHNETQQQLGKEFDADGVEISVHMNPAPDHQEVQGRQFSNEEFDNFQNDRDAVSYDKIKFPAEYDGRDRRSISQYNCYHYVFSIVLGVNKPQYSNKQLKKIIDNNNRGFDFEGKHYTMYEGQQLQRKIELEIRKQKDLQIAGKSAGNESLILQSQQKITQLTQKYKELSKASGLPTKAERMRVSGYKRQNMDYYKAPKVLKADDVLLQKTLEYGNIGVVLPKNVKLEDVRVIAGYGTTSPLKKIKMLTKNHPTYKQVWQKKAGMLKGKYNNYEIHWFENEGRQEYLKIKQVKQK